MNEELKNIKENVEFAGFPKMARLSRECIITEKIDGTNAQVFISDNGDLFAGSRNRWITPESDNYGFARWVQDNREELLKLGSGRHFGEWWGNGVQRGYRVSEKRFSLFNVNRWGTEENFPLCCHLVPVLYRGIFTTEACEQAINWLRENGSAASPGFYNPEGIVCFHVAGNIGFKKTLEKDESPKTLAR